MPVLSFLFDWDLDKYGAQKMFAKNKKLHLEIKLLIFKK